MRERVFPALLAAVLLSFAAAGIARADNCSSKFDCLQTAGFNQAVALTGAGIALTAGLLGPLIGGLLAGSPTAPGLITDAVPQDPLGLAGQYSGICNTYTSALAQLNNTIAQSNQLLKDQTDYDQRCAERLQAIDAAISSWNRIGWVRWGAEWAGLVWLGLPTGGLLPEAAIALKWGARALWWLKAGTLGAAAAVGTSDPMNQAQVQQAISQLQTAKQDVTSTQAAIDANCENQQQTYVQQVTALNDQVNGAEASLQQLAAEMDKGSIPYTPCPNLR